MRKEAFHTLQIGVAGVVLLVALIIYNYGPLERIQLDHDVVLVALAFLFGKFTNGWSKEKPDNEATRPTDHPAFPDGGRANREGATAWPEHYSDIAVSPIHTPGGGGS